MRKEKMIIKSVETIAKDTVAMILEQQEISSKALPGQFLHIAINGFNLRRPISIADVDKEAGHLTILFKILGAGTEKLATYRPGMYLDVLGPNGNGFDLEEIQGKKVLLVGGGIGVPPLYYLGRKLREEQVEVISVIGFQSREHVFYEEEFQKLGQTIIVTNDGSYGEKGFVTDVLHMASDAESYCACGPLGMLKAITEELHAMPGMVSLEERMACGVGACMACMLPTKDEQGYRKICSDGPVFSTEEVHI